MKLVVFEDLPKGWQEAIIECCDKRRNPLRVKAAHTAPIKSLSARSAREYRGLIIISEIFRLGAQDAKERGII